MCLLPLPHPADIGLVHVHLQLELRKVLGQREKHGRLERGGHGLPRLDRAPQNHAVDRRADDRLRQIGASHIQRGLRLGDGRLGAGLVGPGAGEGGLGRFHLA